MTLLIFKRPLIILGSAMIGSLATWAAINWIPSIVILVGGLAFGYVAYLLTDSK